MERSGGSTESRPTSASWEISLVGRRSAEPVRGPGWYVRVR
jgi:hypothetical protein